MSTRYVVVEPNREQPAIAALVDAGAVRIEIHATFCLVEARAPFERLALPGTRGRVVPRVADE